MRELAKLLGALTRAPVGKWDVIKFALGSDRRTGRLIAILLAMTASTTASAALVYAMYLLTHR